ncbi:hypothetical protein [Acidovorax sp. ACV01]|nr:hypothetical protein [Acidovorax sp. ACV01]
MSKLSWQRKADAATGATACTGKPSPAPVEGRFTRLAKELS